VEFWESGWCGCVVGRAVSGPVAMSLPSAPELQER
jgi:hypothetical protein